MHFSHWTYLGGKFRQTSLAVVDAGRDLKVRGDGGVVHGVSRPVSSDSTVMMEDGALGSSGGSI